MLILLAFHGQEHADVLGTIEIAIKCFPVMADRVNYDRETRMFLWQSCDADDC